MLQYFYKPFLFFLFFNSIASSFSAQTNLSIGAFIAPTITHPQYTFYTNNPNNLSLTYGVSIDYAFNKSWSISIRPSYSKQNYFSDCVDSTDFSNAPLSTANSAVGLYPYFISSNNNCSFTSQSSIDFFEIPVFLKFTFKTHKWEKLKKYLFIGNTFRVYHNTIDKITNNLTHELINSRKYYSNNENSGVLLFYPTIDGGLEYLLKDKLILFSDLSIRVHPDNYFKNFTSGLTFGIKANL